jgi:hypothetical protein
MRFKALKAKQFSDEENPSPRRFSALPALPHRFGIQRLQISARSRRRARRFAPNQQFTQCGRAAGGSPQQQSFDVVKFS